MKLTHECKLAAIQDHLYLADDRPAWKPEAGMYYTIIRNDLELHTILSVENGVIRTQMVGQENISDWDEEGFTTEGFGPQRIPVPVRLLEYYKD